MNVLESFVLDGNILCIVKIDNEYFAIEYKTGKTVTFSRDDKDELIQFLKINWNFY